LSNDFWWGWLFGIGIATVGYVLISAEYRYRNRRRMRDLERRIAEWQEGDDYES
jgi:hypothetical protein